MQHRRNRRIVAVIAMALLPILAADSQPAAEAIGPATLHGEGAAPLDEKAVLPRLELGLISLVCLGCGALLLGSRAAARHRTVLRGRHPAGLRTATPARSTALRRIAAGTRSEIEGIEETHTRTPRNRLMGALRALDPARVRARIRNEWSVAERAGQPFTVLAFRVPDPRVSPRTALRLLQALRARLRPGDEVGWLDRRRLAVLLPATTSDDARATAASVAAELRRRGGPPRSLATGAATVACDQAALMGLLAEKPLPWWKRAMDVAGAASGLLLVAPVLLVAAVMVKLSSPGPILFRQRRAGWLGVPFVIYKFRTMVDGAEALKERLRASNERNGPVFKMARDPRITRVGRLLRATSIDELPQLWNVLKGDMSLVGPRPPSLDEVPQYASWQRHRLDVNPGITCLWQVEARGGVDFADWVRMDLRYIRRRSPLYDLSLMARTVPAVISMRGAS